jgi:hypothetical protein
LVAGLAIGSSLAARQQPNPRQQPGATIHIFAPEQHDLYDGHFVISANRIYMVGTVNDPEGWDHLDNEAKNVRPVSGTAEIDVNEIRDTGTFVARLTIPEGDLVLAMDRWHEFSPCQDGGIEAYIHEHGTDSGCGDANWPKSLLYVAGWGLGRADLDGEPLHRDLQIHFMVTQGMRDRETLVVHRRSPDDPSAAGAVDPAAQQVDFYVRSAAEDARNRPGREVFDHFFAMEVTWR